MRKIIRCLACFVVLSSLSGCAGGSQKTMSSGVNSPNVALNYAKTSNSNSTTNPPVPQQEIRVMTIGGSIAHGWKDPSGSGFLHRTFETLTSKTNVSYEMYDKTIPGANGTQLATMYRGDYRKWLTSVNPQIVVISWGLLNDAEPKTPVIRFRQYIQQEITMALSHNAVVFMVTPPVTKASYTQFKSQQQMYVRNEMEVAEKFHSPNVYVFNVFGQMKKYLANHNLTYLPYMGDAWHPNTAGHILASNLLVKDVIKKFGDQPIQAT